MSDNMIPWQRSSYCSTGQCVEAAKLGGGNVAVRDSKNPDQPWLVFTDAEWHEFLDRVDEPRKRMRDEGETL
jgi:hypothetical protein